MNLLVIRNYIHQELVEETKTKYNEFLVYGGFGLYGRGLLEKVFFEDKLNLQYDYLCFIDEDCIVSDFSEIIKMMETSDIDVVGVPDGNCVHMRIQRPDIPNMFFLIIKTEKLKILSVDDYQSCNVNIGYSGKTFSFDNFEPYYQFFQYIKNKLSCNFFYLNAKTSNFDNTTTELYFDNTLFGAHTWYSRIYHIKDVYDRINSSIKYYKNILFNKITLPFDKTYCLHLVESQERYNHITNQFKNIGIDKQVEIWWTCRHPKTERIARWLRDNGEYYWNGFGNGGAFNCTREQYQIVKTAYLRGLNSVCVMEDDITFVGAIDKIKKVFDTIPNDYDILRLCYIKTSPVYKESEDSLFVESYDKYFWGCQMYALSRRGMEYFIKTIDENYCVSDYPLFAIDKIKESGLKNYLLVFDDIFLMDNEINNNTLIQQ